MKWFWGNNIYLVSKTHSFKVLMTDFHTLRHEQLTMGEAHLLKPLKEIKKKHGEKTVYCVCVFVYVCLCVSWVWVLTHKTGVCKVTGTHWEQVMWKRTQVPSNAHISHSYVVFSWLIPLYQLQFALESLELSVCLRGKKAKTWNKER